MESTEKTVEKTIEDEAIFFIEKSYPKKIGRTKDVNTQFVRYEIQSATLMDGFDNALMELVKKFSKAVYPDFERKGALNPTSK